MEAKRIKIFLLSVFIILFALCIRFFYLAAFKNTAYTRAVEAQSVANMSLGKKRGIIYDRNMIPLTEREMKRIYIDSEGQISDKKSNIEIMLPQRYEENGGASHIIGYATDESGGMSGIEKKYDSFLSRDEKYTISYSADSLGRPKKQFYVYQEFERDKSDGLILTLDYHIQKIAEKVLRKYVDSGAVVILDVKSFDILAMASVPEFDKNEITYHLSSDGTEMLNRSLCQYNPGSVFKIVTAISAIENMPHILNQVYECKGSYTTSDFHTFPCHKSEGHGIQNLKSAFANSCNCFFYSLGEKLGGKNICDTAKRLGLGSTLLSFEDEEAGGNIAQKDFYTPGESANISIGQGDILMTPLQCASLVATVASGGLRKDINIADFVTDRYESFRKNLKNDGEYEAISAESATAIKDMMRECVLSGTAKEAGKSSVSIAGKTGSAETGWVQDDGSFYVHGWFCGFFPYESPKYAMAIVCEDGESGSMSCVKPFVEICEEIDKIYPIKQ